MAVLLMNRFAFVGMQWMFLFIAFLSSTFIGIANREDEELKFFRRVLFFVIYISLNVITFFE